MFNFIITTHSSNLNRNQTEAKLANMKTKSIVCKANNSQKKVENNNGQ